ncbi:MAG TPA: plastocyanin/azurin family copper-binding protein [Solirubrobacterales bacterium]|nr:plastocyanin/azurin family copper-binding protein [Solirubrobacterales bacterium]
MRTAAAFLTALAAGLLMVAALAAPSGAKSTRVSITDFQWSNPSPQIDLNESVTWDWIGPDTQHSVSGQEPNATQWDSDPGSVQGHALGDTFTVKFDQPGIYLFLCKLHSSVRGNVNVSNVPGDPNSDPGPQAPLNFDLESPYVDDVRFETGPYVGPKGKGTNLVLSTNERGRAEADYYQLVKRGKRTVKKFRGYSTWEDLFIGTNTIKFAGRSATFKAKPGKYEAEFRVSDQRFNTTEPFKIQFQINKKTKRKGK